MRPSLLACSLLLPLTMAATLALAQPAREPSMRVAVVRKVEFVRPKTASARSDARVEAANNRIEEALSSLGVEAVYRPELATCRDPACLRRLRDETGNTHLLNVEAAYTFTTKSYSIAVAIFETGSGTEVSRKSGRCDDLTCTAPRMNQEIATLVREAVTEARNATPPPPPQPAPPPQATRAELSAPNSASAVSTAPPRNTSDAVEPPRGRGFGWWAIGGGAAVAVAGGVVLSQNGKLSDCGDSKNDRTCRTTLNTKTPGFALLSVGGAALLIGGLDLVGVFGSGSGTHATAIIVGPTSVTFAGRF